jgi:hypothetical protein
MAEARQEAFDVAGQLSMANHRKRLKRPRNGQQVSPHLPQLVESKYEPMCRVLIM